MFKNLFFVALRNFKRDKWYCFINILGLTIGITFSLFLIFYVKDELSYDKCNVNANRIYRMTAYVKEPEKDTMKWATTQFLLGPTLKNDYPEVEQFARFVGNDKVVIKNGDLSFYENKIYYSDSSLFNVFTYLFVEGNPNKALVEPNSIVLTKSFAEKYFGNKKNYLGRTLQNDKGEVFKVTAIINDVPRNSHIIFNALISISTLPKHFADSWGSFGFYTYVLLKPNTDAIAFEKKLRVMYEKYMASIFSQFKIKIHYGLQPIASIHLRSDMSNEPEELGSFSYIYIFSSVAFFMLIIACINYMNLTTARSARRAKEIGIRKVAGSSKYLLISQFLIESTLITIIALLLSMLLVALLLPTFNTLSGKFISFRILLEPETFVVLTGIVLFVGIAGGSYPAFYLSNVNPIDVLKGSLSKSSGNVNLRRSLVVVQFAVSMIMVISTWIVYGQLKFLQTRDLGFDKSQVISVIAHSRSDLRTKISAFKNESREVPEVNSVSTADATPGNSNIGFNLFSVQSKEGFVDKGVDCYGVDQDYFRTLGMQIKKGRNFTGLQDTLRSIIVNENMVKYFGWDNPIGKKVRFPGDTSQFYLEVVGVVKDFNQKSLYNPIAPLILFYKPSNNNIQLKISATNISSTIAGLEKLWRSIFPELPFQYTFLDQDYDSQYAADQKRGKIFTAFSILTILITCLGLLGLIAFTTEQRQKEISLRKIMGAGLGQIVQLITINFVLLVAISCVIAFPVAYFFMGKWLNMFTYRTGLSATPFLFSALAILFITLLTVAFHAVKAAVANLAGSLRAE